MLAVGQAEIVGEAMLAEKGPRFDGNAAYDFSVFGERKAFDFVMAGSIWTHAPRGDIDVMMGQFRQHSHAGSVFLGSFVRTDGEGYTGNTWVGKSHESDKAGLVSHRFESLRAMAATHGLALTHLEPQKRNCISWLKMTRG